MRVRIPVMLLLAVLAAGCERSPGTRVAPPGPTAPVADDRALLADRLREARRVDAGDDPAEAERCWNAVLALRPDHASALYAAATWAWRRRDAEVALDLLGRLVQVDPRAGRAHLLIARILADPEAGGRFDLALASGEIGIAMDLNPEESGPYALAAEVAWLDHRTAGEASGTADSVEDLLRDALRMNPRDERSRVLLALHHLDAGDPAEARALLEAVVASGPALEVGGGHRGLAGEGDSRAHLPDPGPFLLAHSALALLDTGAAAAGDGVAAMPEGVPGVLRHCLALRGSGESMVDLDRDGRHEAAAASISGHGTAFACIVDDKVVVVRLSTTEEE